MNDKDVLEMFVVLSDRINRLESMVDYLIHNLKVDPDFYTGERYDEYKKQCLELHSEFVDHQDILEERLDNNDGC